MTDSQRDPIAAAVEGACSKFTSDGRRPGRYDVPGYDGCKNCQEVEWRHWLRALREKLAELEASFVTKADWVGLQSKLAHKELWLSRTTMSLQDAEARLCKTGLDLDDAREKLAETERERDEAMIVLAPNMPESGLVDACRQVKQAAISEADNSEQFLQVNTRLREALGKLEWSGWQMFDQEGEDRCPGCGAYKGYPHEPKCLLAAALAHPQTATTETSDG